MRSASRPPPFRRRTAGGLATAGVMVVALTLLFLPGSPVAPALPSHAAAFSSGHPAPRAIARPAAPPPAPTWINLSAARPGPAPGFALEASVAWDPADQEYVEFGGCGAACPVFNATWTFAHGAWTNATSPGPAPPMRVGASMTYDPHAGGVLLFGGVGVASVLLNDTWLFRDGTWTNVSALGAAPPPRSNGAIAYDPDPGENGTVLFGGCATSAVCDNATYVWGPSSGWSLLASGGSGPSGRELAGMAYDAADHYLVLYGGVGPCPGGTCDWNQTWEFYAGTWWRVTPHPAPLGLEGPGLGFDGALGKVLLVGGYNASRGVLSNETWLFSAGAWTNATTPVAPSERALFAMTDDASGAAPLVFSGFSSGLANDTWAYAAAPSVGLTGPSGALEANAPAGFSATVTGGTAPFSASFSFGDSTTAAAPGDGPTFAASHPFAAAGDFSVAFSVTDALGLSASGTLAVTVGAAPSVAIGAEPGATDVGRSVLLTATLVGGATPASFAWTLGDGSGGTGSPVNHSYAAPGRYLVVVNATDALGGVAEATATVVVAPSLGVGATACVGSACGSAATPAAGAPVAFSGNLTGGTGPFAYRWTFGDGSSSAAPAPEHAYALPGTYSYQLSVTDAAGASATTQGSVVVGPAAAVPAPAAGATPPIPTWFWAGLAGILGAGVVGGVLILRRRPGTTPDPRP